VGAFDDTCRQDPVVAAIIARDGVFVDEGLQVQTPSFGNEELTEETADTVTVGGVFEPRFAPGLQLSVDYYDIEIEDAIADIDAIDILRICYASGDFGGTPSCAIPLRDPVTGQLAENPETSLNINRLSTSGIDATIAYGFSPGATGLPLLSAIPGDVRLTGTLTRVLEYETEAPVPGTDDTFIEDELGLLGRPETRGRFSATWDNGPITLAWRTTVIGEMLNDDVDRTRLNACREFNNCDDKIALFLDRELTHNLRLNYDLPAFLFDESETELYFGVNNVFNNQGPVLYGANDGVNDGDVGENHHSLYDITGRFFYGGVTVEF
ncbi:MAG: TonB-dependent receptor, partial [Caulobacterales bacterium]|nr:TonB-dependent receptor [Caulobacterales bacterium]